MKQLKYLITILVLSISSTCFAEYVPDTNIWKEYFNNKKGTMYYAPCKIKCFDDGAYISLLYTEKKTDRYHNYRYKLYFPEKSIESSYYSKVDGKTGKILTEQDYELSYMQGSMSRSITHYTQYFKDYENIINEAYDKWLNMGR